MTNSNAFRVLDWAWFRVWFGRVLDFAKKLGSDRREAGSGFRVKTG